MAVDSVVLGSFSPLVVAGKHPKGAAPKHTVYHDLAMVPATITTITNSTAATATASAVASANNAVQNRNRNAALWSVGGLLLIVGIVVIVLATVSLRRGLQYIARCLRGHRRTPQDAESLEPLRHQAPAVSEVAEDPVDAADRARTAHYARFGKPEHVPMPPRVWPPPGDNSFVEADVYGNSHASSADSACDE